MVVDDEGKLHNFIGKAVNEWGSAYGLFFTFVGDKLGLFKAMAGAAGFSKFHSVTQTPFNLIFEARP